MSISWSHLPNDLCSLIGNKLDVEVDRFCFRSVCSSWRSCLPPFPQPPWLLLSESQPEQQPLQLSEENDSTVDEEEEEEEKVRSSNTSPPPRHIVGIGGDEEKQVIYEINLPEAHQNRVVGSTGTWLITVDLSCIIHLLNPFSRVQIDLPSQFTFEHKVEGDTLSPEDKRDSFLRKVVMSSTPSSLLSNSNCISKDCVVMAIHHYRRYLAFVRPGDKCWTTVETPRHLYEDIIFYKEQFYAVTTHGTVVICDIGHSGLHSPTASICSETWNIPHEYRQKKYLVEWLGELLLVIKHLSDLDEDGEKEIKKELPLYRTEKFTVHKLDFISKNWEEVDCLGEYCLFVGSSTSVSVLAHDYSKCLKKNCIYFTDDYTLGYRGTETPGGLDMGMFDMEDKSIRPHYKGVSTCYYSPPLWIIPNSLVK